MFPRPCCAWLDEVPCLFVELKIVEVLECFGLGVDLMTAGIASKEIRLLDKLDVLVKARSLVVFGEII